jgi:transposase
MAGKKGCGGPKGNRKSTEQRRAAAAKLRADGLSLAAIAEQLGVVVSTAAMYCNSYYSALAEEGKDASKAARELDLARLDRAILGLHQRIADGDTQAVQALVKVLDRRAKLLGLDAPSKQEIADTTTVARTPQEIRAAVMRRFGSNVGPTIEDDEGTDDAGGPQDA